VQATATTSLYFTKELTVCSCKNKIYFHLLGTRREKFAYLPVSTARANNLYFSDILYILY